MTGERWQRVKAIFQAALERAPAERTAFVTAACADDQTLQTEVESLLKEQAALPSSSATALEGGLVAKLLSQAQQVAGQRIGPYQIIRELGRGGMGVVYLAERADGQFEQRVALKLIRRGLAQGEVLRRFRYERQILAGLDHPNIARLLDGGATEDGTPYFALEYIEGQPLDEYCRAQKLSVPQRLELFRSVCSAVHYAHQNLVVHRDLKPSNILVTPPQDGKAGVPKLLDFGIAKLLNPTQFDLTEAQTQTSVRPMTPAYASPEQVRGAPVTTASDIYALGVVLYELLTGRRPYEIEGRSVREIEQAICDSEPERPSTALSHASHAGKRRAAVLRASLKTGALRSAADTQSEVFDEASAAGLDPERAQRQLRGDLDNIVLMALRKEPQRRYASVEQLSEDLRRHLAGLPITARPNTFSYRTGKFIRRHKAGVLAAALVVLSLVSGLFVALRQARIAERRFNEVRQLANVYLFEFHDAIEKLPGATPARQLVVKRALEYLASLSQEVSGDRALQRELATAYLRVGDVQGRPGFPNLGDFSGALDSYRKALALRAPLLQAAPGAVELQREHANNLDRLGDALRMSGSLGAALEHYRQALALREPLATRAQPDYASSKADLAFDHEKLGTVLAARGELDTALAQHRQAAKLREELVRTDPQNAETKRDLAGSYAFIGEVGLRLQHAAARREACAAYQRSRELWQALQAQQKPSTAETATLQQIVAALEKCK